MRNFKESEASLLSKLKQAEIVSFDLEFAGINTEEPLLKTDTPFEYFYKLVTVPTQNAVFTLGMTVFTPSTTKGSDPGALDAYCYNFYLRPQFESRNANKMALFDVTRLKMTRENDP